MKKIAFFLISILLVSCVEDDDFQKPEFDDFICPQNMTVGDTILLDLKFENEVLPDLKKVTFYTNAGEFLSGNVSSGKDSSEVLVFDNNLKAQVQLVLKNDGMKLFGFSFDYMNSRTFSENFCVVDKKSSTAPIDENELDFSICHESSLDTSDIIFIDLNAMVDRDRIHGTEVEFSTNAGRFVENPIDFSAVVDTINLQFINSLARTQVKLTNIPGNYFFRYRFTKDSVLYLEECYLDID